MDRSQVATGPEEAITTSKSFYSLILPNGDKLSVTFVVVENAYIPVVTIHRASSFGGGGFSSGYSPPSGISSGGQSILPEKKGISSLCIASCIGGGLRK